jgi:mRNA-degrading endonuclease YafQ of YafQ-DinJ toxin-antitoxin module
MRILRHKNFEKQYQKLPAPLRAKVDCALVEFISNPFAKRLRNHALSGRLRGKRAFSATSDIRIVFEEFYGYTIVVMLAVGTHSQVY